MTAVFQVLPNEREFFIDSFKKLLPGFSFKVTVESLSPEEETRQKMLRAIAADKRGEGITMTIEELKAMVK
jgi:ATP adenylyltransferase/5',5'''-P-1,P-4-tetraphosphate phosphorylase II